MVAPPGIAGSVGRQYVAHHVVSAIAIGLAYIIVAAVAGFFVVIAKDVSSRWQKRLADRVDLFLQRKAPRFERHYRDFALAGLRYVDTKGLVTVGPFTPELDEVFVDVSLVSRPPQQIAQGILPEQAGDLNGRRALSDFLGGDRPVVLAVVGAPGSGKTTLLRHTAGQSLDRKTSRRTAGRDLPILLYLRDHVHAITADEEVSLAELVRTTLRGLRASEPDGWFEQKLLAGRCQVLLDGLDEVARWEDRKIVASWAEAQIRQYSGNDFVISSRPRGYQSAPTEGATVVQVCGLAAEQVKTFIRSWYRSAERHGTGASGPDIEVRAASGADDLLRRLEKAPALRDLTVNPLLLTMMANVHRYRGALPGSRADLYYEICQVMLSRRQEAKNLVSELAADKKEAILRPLAYTMMKDRVTDLTRADVLARIRPGLRRVAKDITPEDFLADMSSSGVFIEREAEQYAFAHHTFQEYLAADHIRDKGLADVLAETVNDDWWREVILLYATRSDADPVVKACLEADTVPALALAFDCEEQGSELAAELRDRLSALLASALKPGCDSERRQLIAGVTLTRHLRDQLRTADGMRVCARPITSEIYRFFRDDQKNTLTVSGQAAGLAVGISGADAEAFVRWANKVAGEQSTYRLPRRAELDDVALRLSVVLGAAREGLAYAVWMGPSSTAEYNGASMWMPSRGGNCRKVDGAALLARIANDQDVLRPAQLVILLLRMFIKVPFRAHDRARDRARALDLARALALDSDLALDIDFARASALARARALDLALALDLDLAFDSVGFYDPSGGVEAMISRAMGRTLAEAAEEAHRVSDTSDAWIEAFPVAFVAAAAIGDEWTFSADPNTLMELLTSAVTQLHDANGASDWAATVAERLADNAGPVFDGHERLGKDKAAVIRIAALCLAGEADGLERSDIGEMFRQIAGGITALEMAEAGENPVIEVLMLAVD